MTEEYKESPDVFKADARALRIVDSREPETLRQPLITTGWTQKMIFSGDFAFMTHDYKKFGITRKSTDDLLNSINETWAHQLDVMLDYYDINKILIEGSWAKITPNAVTTYTGVSKHLTWDSIWNWLDRWMTKGFTLEITVSQEHTIHRLNELYALYQKPYSANSKSRVWADDRVLSFPSGCRGKTAMNVLKVFGSLQNIANAEAADFTKIDGIGAKKANTIYEHFRKGEKEKDGDKQEIKTVDNAARVVSKEQSQMNFNTDEGVIKW